MQLHKLCCDGLSRHVITSRIETYGCEIRPHIADEVWHSRLAFRKQISFEVEGPRNASMKGTKVQTLTCKLLAHGAWLVAWAITIIMAGHGYPGAIINNARLIDGLGLETQTASTS